MDTQPIDDLDGLVVETNVFQDFIVQEILQEYDGPLLLVAVSPEGESWLFKWCDTVDSSVERWIAFQISESRLKALKNDDISLREAVTLYEKEPFYILETQTSLFKPSRIKMSYPEKLPIGYLPSDDVSINGRLLSLKLQEEESLTVRLHVFSQHISEGKSPLSIISRLQNHFQEYMTWVAHAFDRDPEEPIPPSFKDWTGFNLTNVASGSFKMECVSNSNREETKRLTKACQLLANLSNGLFDINSVEREFDGISRSDIIRVSSFLANFVSSFDLSMSITWASSDNPNGYLAIDKRRVDNFLRYLDSLQDEQRDSITIELSPEEADPLRIPVKGNGGWQNLVRKLNTNLTQENKITLTPKDIERILRYNYLYGQGGFQNQLDGIAVKLKRIGVPFNIA
jgi:hypothetical protein